MIILFIIIMKMSTLIICRQVVVDFGQLALNFDVNTVLHLRPFMEALLRRPSPSPSDLPLDPLPASASASTSHPHSLPLSATTSGKSIATIIPTSKSSTLPSDVTESRTKGMHVLFTVTNISLDLLRVASGDIEGAELQSAFSLQIEEFRADVDMMDLITAGLDSNICI